MSLLSIQTEGLREAANRLDEIGISMGHGTTASAFIAHDASERMREAAYTIEGLRDRLQELQGVTGESRYMALFGTPERAARTMVDMCEGGTFDDCGGCPAALAECKLGDYDALLEWLRGDA